MVRAPCCSKVGLKRGPWSSEEDALLTNYIHQYGEGQWRSLPKKAGLLRCGKSCRLRWMNYLRPGIKRGNITEDEEDLIVRLQRLLGNRWSLIAGRIPNRTDNEIKNHWNTHLLKKLQNAGINPNKKKIKKREIVLKGNKSEVNDDKRCNEEEEVEEKVSNEDGGPRKKIKVYWPKPIRVSASLVLPRTESMDSFVSGASSGGEAAEPPVSELPENDGYYYGFGDDVMSDDILTPLLHGDDLGHALDSMYDEYLQLL